jgi:hypothetical protein
LGWLKISESAPEQCGPQHFNLQGGGPREYPPRPKDRCPLILTSGDLPAGDQLRARITPACQAT